MPEILNGFGESVEQDNQNTIENEIKRLINSGNIEEVNEMVRDGSGLSEKTALALINAGYAFTVAYYLENFENLTITHDKLAQIMIDAKQADAVADNLENFKNLSEKTVTALINAGQARAVAHNLENFENLSEKTALALINAGYASYVTDNLNSFGVLPANKLQLLNFSYTKFDKYISETKPEDLTEDHIKLLEILQETKLRSDELPKDILSRERWSAEEVVEEVFDTISDINSATPLLNFGFTKMQLIHYADREGLSRHDAFLLSTQIATLFNQSKLRPSQFYDQILAQVQMDDASYVDGTAHHRLNAISNRGVPSLEQVKEKITTLPEGMKTKVENMFESFDSDSDIFSSWKNLKSYSEKCFLLFQESERLTQIYELEVKGKNKLARWYEVISRSNNVDTGALTEFLVEPEHFFDRDASFVGNELHENKKPSNYYNIPNLDLTAEELRDALVEGYIDKIASISPMEIAYEIAPEGKYLANEIADMPLVQKVSTFLGSKKNKIEGLAVNPGKLFNILGGILKPYQITINKFLSGEEVLPESATKLVEDTLRECDFKKHLVVSRGDKYIVSIHPKSSPHGVLAGNDTACCMPFGDGKAILYMINPVCAQFTIQKENEDGATRRTLIQSVMTLNYPIPGRSVPELIDLLQSSRNLSEVLPDETMLTMQVPLLVADNAESSPNFRESIGAGELARLLYQDFFARYLASQEDGAMRLDQVQIGAGYSDVVKDLPQVRNETVPAAPLSYSDNTHSSSYQLTPQLASSGRVHIETKIPGSANEMLRKTTGVSELTYLDTLPTAYLESKVYQDAADLLSGLHDMENALIAVGINNSVKNRVNLSLKYVDTDGKFRSYILAYEGKWRENGEACIYISDFASDQKSSSAGFVLRQFCKRYRENYLEKGNPLPIYAEMRESTSYRLITDEKNKDSIKEWLGVKEIEVDEIDSYSIDNGEIMHVVKLSPL